MLLKRLRTLLVLCSVLWMACASVLATPLHIKGSPLLFCGEIEEWPPYNFFKRVDGKKTNETIGYDIDVINWLMNRGGIPYKIEIIPWQRCLAKVLSGDSQVVMSASTSAKREKNYLLSSPYYSVTPAIAYLTNRYSDSNPIIAVKTDQSFVLCGRNGYNYANFGTLDILVSSNAGSHLQLIKMLRSGRCNAFLTRLEALKGLPYTHPDLNLDDISTASIPQSSNEPFYFMISRKFEYAFELKGFLDEGIRAMKAARVDQDFRSQYLH